MPSTADDLPAKSSSDAAIAAQIYDVTIIGGGLAGKAAAQHLAKDGLKVVCIEPETAVREAVGESLDWSAPELLKTLGLPMEFLVESQMATWKRHVTIKMSDGCSAHYIPTESLAGPPLHIELRTLHVDRLRLDAELMKLALGKGVTLVRDKVVEIERRGQKILSVQTAAGKRFASNWYIDASGSSASILGREFSLRSWQYGPPKVAIWTYLKAPEMVEGTTIYIDPSPNEYLEWIWEIPVNPEMVSVGYITTGAATKAKREQGLSADDILRKQLAKFSHFEPLVAAGSFSETNVTSFRCRVYSGVAGPNWLLAGESASMVDPITSNGVTAALRHAAEASALIVKYHARGSLPWHARFAYNGRIVQMAKFFNSGVEKIVYEPPVRNRISLQNSGTVYTTPAWSMNVVYARLKPKGLLKTFFLGSVLGFFRASAWGMYWFCRMFGGAVGESGGR